MRTATAAELEVYASDDYATETRLLVGDVPAEASLDPVDFLGYDPFLGVTLESDVESPVVKGEIILALGSGTQSLSPYMTGGMWVGGRPLFDSGRYVSLFTRLVGRYRGAPPAGLMPWRPAFLGEIDTSDPNAEDETLTLHCRDFYSDWLDCQLEPNEDTGSWQITGGNVTDVLAQLIALTLTGPNVLHPWVGPVGQAFFNTIGTPTLGIPTYMQEPGSLLLALQSAASLNGWDLRGRFNALDQWVMTYYEPDRARTGPVSVVGPDRWVSFQGLAKSRDEVRNRVRVVPADAPRTPAIREDQTSIDTYRLKPVSVAEDAQSRILSWDQADALALAILLDSKSPKVMATVDTNYHPFVELNDVLILQANGITHDTDLVASPSGLTHAIAGDGSALTTLHTRDLPAAASARWRQGEPRMAYSSLNPPSGVAAEGARWVHQKAST